jgi:iron(III) transport system substrate-binding protein
MKWLKYAALSFLITGCLFISGCGMQSATDSSGSLNPSTNESLVVKESTSADINSQNEKETTVNYDGKPGKITVYISGPAPMLEALEQNFEESRGDVVDFLHLGCGPLRQKVWTEKEAGQIQADVVWGSDPLMYIKLADANALEKYKPNGYDSLNEEYKIGDNYYTLASERYGVILYNSDNVTGKKIPKSFADLEKIDWNGSLILADATQSSTALALTSALYELSGNNFDYLSTLNSNNLFLTKKNGEVSTKIASGEFDGGIAPHDGAIRILKKAKKEGYTLPIKIAWPNEGALAIQRPIAIIENPARPAENETIAREFVDFIISKKAQTITTKFGFISVRSDVELPLGIPDNVKVLPINWRKASENEDALRSEFKTIMQNK